MKKFAAHCLLLSYLKINKYSLLNTGLQASCKITINDRMSTET